MKFHGFASCSWAVISPLTGRVEDALKASCQTEELTGSEQYDCNQCGKQDATRTVSLKRFPNVLVLKLMRFIYDLKKGIRQKVCGPLSIGPVVNCNSGEGGGL